MTSVILFALIVLACLMVLSMIPSVVIGKRKRRQDHIPDHKGFLLDTNDDNANNKEDNDETQK